MQLSRILLPVMLASCCLAQQPDPVEEVRQASSDWVTGIGRGDPDHMVSLYADDAILHGTISPVLRDTPALIREYFSGTATNPPTMSFIEPQHIRVHGDIAVNTGFYQTRFGNNPPLTLRYSFVYRREGGRWLIIDHHSSRLPE